MPARDTPLTDPSPIFELVRGNYATELLTAAVAHFHLFGALAQQPMTFAELGRKLKLATRPLHVLVTALRAFGLLKQNDEDVLSLTELAAEHLVPGGAFDVGGYVGLSAQSPGVLELVERLKSNKPHLFENQGTAYIYRDGAASAMDSEDSARHFTLALAGRARIVAPVLAERLPLAGARRLLDVACGSGIYTFALLRKNPSLKGILLDRPEVLKVAAEMAREFGVADRVEFVAVDMFKDEWPRADVVLLSNVLHDWDEPECRLLIGKGAAALEKGGRLLIHDVFLNDALDGPLPIALYSAALFSLTEGRAYSAAEYRGWLKEAGLESGDLLATSVSCQLLEGKARR